MLQTYCFLTVAGGVGKEEVMLEVSHNETLSQIPCSVITGNQAFFFFDVLPGSWIDVTFVERSRRVGLGSVFVSSHLSVHTTPVHLFSLPLAEVESKEEEIPPAAVKDELYYAIQLLHSSSIGWELADLERRAKPSTKGAPSIKAIFQQLLESLATEKRFASEFTFVETVTHYCSLCGESKADPAQHATHITLQEGEGPKSSIQSRFNASGCASADEILKCPCYQKLKSYYQVTTRFTKQYPPKLVLLNEHEVESAKLISPKLTAPGDLDYRLRCAILHCSKTGLWMMRCSGNKTQYFKRGIPCSEGPSGSLTPVALLYESQ